MAGTERVVRRFPFRVGRSNDCELSLEDPGVWDQHFRIELSPPEIFELFTEPNTSVVIDGNIVQQKELRNGEVIELGSAKILFSLSATRQKSQTFRERLTWVSLAVLVAGQIFLILELLN